jgi:hypothetical protein
MRAVGPLDQARERLVAHVESHRPASWRAVDIAPRDVPRANANPSTMSSVTGSSQARR